MEKLVVKIKTKSEGLELLKNVQKNCASGLAIRHTAKFSDIWTDTVLATVSCIDTDKEGFVIDGYWEFSISSNYWSLSTLKDYIS